MPEIEITEDQRRYLETLREELAAVHVGEYGTVRPSDAVQFLIDRHEGNADALEETDRDAAGVDGSSADEPDPDESESNGASESGGSDGDGPGRLQAMMRLLDDHEDKWEEVDSDQGKYAVELPDGETEHVRTKDDVRGLLFEHYG